MITDCSYISAQIDKLKAQGINIEVVIIDYAAKLASIDRDKEDFERISHIYIDMQNLAEKKRLACIWTANHITRDGAKHRETKYEEIDIAKCVDIVRHAQGIYGLNATQQEEQDGIQRLEVVVQRDGKPSGRALFKIDVDKQRAIEFTKEQRAEYDKIYGQALDESIKKKKKGSIDPEKIAKVADI